MRSRSLSTDLLNELLDQFRGLPPDLVVRADREIAETAELFHEHQLPQQQWLPKFWPRSWSQLGLLAETPRLEQVFLFHRDGRLREAALNKLDNGLDSAFLVAAVALRLNDWASPVRAAATAAAERTFPRTDAKIMARALLFLIGRKDHWRRWGKEPVVIATSLANPDVVAAFADLFRTGEFGGMAKAFRQILRRSEMDDCLLDLARQARQPAVRAIAFQTLIQGRATWLLRFERQWIDKAYNHSRRQPVFAERPVVRPVPLEALIDYGLADRSQAVRLVAADGAILHRAVLRGVSDLAQRLLADTSRAVQGRGEFLRRQERPAIASSGA